MAAPKALVGVVGVTFTAATFLLLVFFFGVPYLKSKWQHGMHSNVHDSGSSAAALDPQSLVNHSDHFFDVFPLDMTKEMHQRVLCIRRMLRKEIRDFDELRSPVPVHQASQLGTCHLVRKDALDSGAEDVDKDVPVLVGDIFTDGMGHSIAEYISQLYIVNQYGCRTTLPNRFSVTRNFVFIPWDASYEFREDGGDRLHLESPHGPSPWIVEEPSRYLYCHQKRSTRNDFKGQSRIYDNQFEYIRSDKYPANMQCNILYVDPWRVICEIATGKPCVAEQNEFRPGGDQQRRRQLRHRGGHRKPHKKGNHNPSSRQQPSWELPKLEGGEISELAEEEQKRLEAEIAARKEAEKLLQQLQEDEDDGLFVSKDEKIKMQLDELEQKNAMMKAQLNIVASVVEQSEQEIAEAQEKEREERLQRAKQLQQQREERLKRVQEQRARHENHPTFHHPSPAPASSNADGEQQQQHRHDMLHNIDGDLRNEEDDDDHAPNTQYDDVVDTWLHKLQMRHAAMYLDIGPVNRVHQSIQGFNLREPAIERTISRIKSTYWDSIVHTRDANAHQPRNLGPLTARYGVVPRWTCGYNSDTLDIAVHIRRGDIFSSNVQLDIDRYTPMSYYRQLMRSLYEAWDESRLLQERYPKIRFHVHSESTDFPPPYGDATTLPEFEDVEFAEADPETVHHHLHSMLECPVGKFTTEGNDDLAMRFCLNINPLYSLYCMAQADVFVASESYFSALVAVTSSAVKVVPSSAHREFFEHKLCQGMGLCTDDPASMKDSAISSSLLEQKILNVTVSENI